MLQRGWAVLQRGWAVLQRGRAVLQRGWATARQGSVTTRLGCATGSINELEQWVDRASHVPIPSPDSVWVFLGGEDSQGERGDERSSA